MDVQWTACVAFHPWVGDNYCRGLEIDGECVGLRVMLLGESHYDDNSHTDKGPSFTCDAILNCLADKESRRWTPAPYWTRTGRLIAGEGYLPSSFWHSVAFYNYLQSFQEIGGHPEPSAWEHAEEPFVEVTTKLKPEVIVVISKRLWAKVGTTAKGVSQAFYINHPRHLFYSREYWHEKVLREFKSLRGWN